MNRDYSRFDSLTSILAGTVTVAGIVVFAAPVFAKTPQEIAKIAESVTVQINRTDNRGATGFIIAKQGTTYTVLTANHLTREICQGLLPILTKRFKLNQIIQKLISIEPSLISI